MSDQQPKKPERRLMIRYPSSGGALVVRDSDKMRSGLDGTLHDVSVAGVGIYTPMSLEVGEQVKVRLRNDVQRFEKEVRGTVQHCTPTSEGLSYIGIALMTRLTPLEVSLLRMGLAKDSSGSQPKWI